MMGIFSSNNVAHIYRRYFSRAPPFDIHNPESLRDPREKAFSKEQLEQLRTMDDTRHLALEYLHDDRIFATLWKSDNLHPEQRRRMRILVQIQTINVVCNGFYRLPDGKKISLDPDLLTNAAHYTKQYSDDYKYQEKSNLNNEPARIWVINGDCLDTVRYFKEKYPNSNPVVLNMANANTPGGGWRDGCGAQEENLHRRSNLFQCLEDSYNQFKDTRTWHYPIPEFGGLYSPQVSVFRGSESQGYPFFPNGPEYVSFIASAAYPYPPTKVNQNGELLLHGKNLVLNTKRKLKAILQIALDNEHDIIILSAFGCGAFRNPPGHIANLFQKVIEQNFSYSFKHIIFAIIDDHNSMQIHNRNGNIQPFSEVFSQQILTINEIKDLV